MLKPLDKENAEVNEISLTKLKKLKNKDTKNRLQDLCHYSQTNNELLAIPPQQSFHAGQGNQSNQSVLLENGFLMKLDINLQHCYKTSLTHVKITYRCGKD